MKKVLLITAFIILFSAVIYSEDSQEEAAGDLYIKTIAIDIETSDFFELATWCERLGLSKDGSAAEMRQRLYGYYKTTPSTDSQDTKKDQQRITIEKADNLEYFTIEKVDESYAKISGGVNVSLYDDKKNETHIIKADTILFNFKENYLTATGNIRYTLDGETKTENFRGEKITFNIDDTEGLFDQGITEQEKTIKEEEVVFYFKGDLINKTAENYVVLENGEITSCDFEEPHYKIKASKIWLLTSNEWAILNGIVYIGRVPVFYLPGVLYPGDDIFINPVFGLRQDYGYYLQTTTYLIGEKEKDEDSPFSFMQSENEKKYYKKEGLFLTEDENPSGFSRKIQDYGSSEKYMKLIFDYYTNLGFYSAVDLKLPKPDYEESENTALDLLMSFISVIDNTELYLSVARTRKIELTGTRYSVLFPDENNNYSSIWYESYLINRVLPFRYGFNYKTAFNLNWLKLNIELAAYSDRDYTKDFADRSENLNLLSLLSLDTKSAEETAASISTYTWKADLSFKPDLKVISPWISNLSINSNSNLVWQSKEITKTGDDYENTVDYFFYPDSYIFPSVSGASLSGQLLPIPDGKKNKIDADGQKDEAAVELRPPWSEEEEKLREALTDDDLPAAVGDLEIDISDYWSDNKIFSNKLTYSVKPSYTNKTQLNTTEWTVPEDIDTADVEYSFKTSAVDAGLDYNANIFGKLFTIRNSVGFSYDNNEHYNMENLSEATRDKYILEDKQKKGMDLKNSLSLTTAPLVYFDLFNKTELKYSFNSLIYKNEYSADSEAFIDSFFQNDKDFITVHSISYNMPFEISDFNQTFNISTTLPPIDLKTTGSYKLGFRISTTEINTSVLQKDDEYSFEPLTINEKLDFYEGTWLSNSISYNYSDLALEKNILSGKLSLFKGKITADSKFEYDFSESRINTLNFSLGIYDTYLKFYAADTYDYIFNPDTGWVQSPEKSFLPTKFTAGINLQTEKMDFWKKRINLDFTVKSELNIDLIKYNNSVFSFESKLNFEIYKFLDLHFSSVSENKAVFRYIPSYCSELGVNHINIAEDLLKSFNFFNIDDRYESNFNLSSITVGLTHDLHDWDLSIDYTGKPYVNLLGEAPFYDWENKLNIYLKWKAIPDIKSEIEIDKQDVSF